MQKCLKILQFVLKSKNVQYNHKIVYKTLSLLLKSKNYLKYLKIALKIFKHY